MNPLMLLGLGGAALWALTRKKGPRAPKTGGAYYVPGKSGQEWKVSASVPSKTGVVTYGVYLPNNTMVLTFMKDKGGKARLLAASPAAPKTMVAKAKADFGL